jgi:CRISPR-associated protein Csd1
MILQALHDYYRRKMADPDPARRLPAFGREDKEIPFILELTPEGRLAGIKDTRAGDKRKSPARYLVPQGVKKTSGIAANLLWDTAEYVLALPDPKKLAEAQAKGKAAEYLQRLQDMQSAFKARIEALPAPALEDADVKAVLAFLASGLAGAVAAAGGGDIAQTNPLISFRLLGDLDLVCQRPALVTLPAPSEAPDDTSAPSICLVTGERAPAERLHPSIRGVWNAQSSGANIVSFNLDAFNSYGKSQGANAPVSAAAVFAYTTALNHLLARDSRQRMQVGDASTVFWAQRAEDAPMEDWFAQLFGDVDDPDGRTEQVRALYEAVRSGRFDGSAGDRRFFVLGLAPNAARVSVRFWHAAPLNDVAQHIRQWFDDLRIARGPHDAEYPGLPELLRATAVLGKTENLPPSLGGDVMRSVLTSSPLPLSLLQAAVQRTRADQARKTDAGKPVPHVSHHRAALMKVCLNRLIRRQLLKGKEIDVSLDEHNRDATYLLGRLFAAYERIQADAAERDLNRSIRDAYFGSAMSNPASVFPRLVELGQRHMSDLRRNKPGLHTVRDQLLGAIWAQLDAGYRFPNSQPLAERARFALGYYHQRQDFFTRKTDTPATPTVQGAH